MAALSYVNIFAKDIVALSSFYMDVFGFTEIEAIRSPIFRGIDTGKSAIGFNALDAYELLKLSDYADTKGIKFLLNIDVDTPEEVDRMVPVALSKGATLIKEPYKTYYNWYQAVLLDPEGNVFRINKMLD
ncbi:VOC family protein [Parvibaculum sp.]|uniref:VOC family protein n=1 Tax=Parvibaculum sp. TaxID=2024848 RepID=UPI00320DF8B1